MKTIELYFDGNFYVNVFNNRPCMTHRICLQVILVGIWQDLGGKVIRSPVCELSIFPPRASTKKLTRKSPETGGSYLGTLSAAISARLDGNSDSVTMVSEAVMVCDTLKSDRRDRSKSDALDPVGVPSKNPPENREELKMPESRCWPRVKWCSSSTISSIVIKRSMDSSGIAGSVVKISSSITLKRTFYLRF